MELRISLQKKELLSEKRIRRKRNCFERRNSLQKKELPSEKEFLAEKEMEELLAEKGNAFSKMNRLQNKKLRNSLQKKDLPSEKVVPLKKRNQGIPPRKRNCFQKKEFLAEKGIAVKEGIPGKKRIAFRN